VEAVEGFVHAPFARVGVEIVEQVLAVVHVEHGVLFVRLPVIRRQVHPDAPVTFQLRHPQRVVQHPYLRGSRVFLGGRFRVALALPQAAARGAGKEEKGKQGFDFKH
jgi:hypothetical protein